MHFPQQVPLHPWFIHNYLTFVNMCIWLTSWNLYARVCKYYSSFQMYEHIGGNLKLHMWGCSRVNRETIFPISNNFKYIGYVNVPAHKVQETVDAKTTSFIAYVEKKDCLPPWIFVFRVLKVFILSVTKKSLLFAWQL